MVIGSNPIRPTIGEVLSTLDSNPGTLPLPVRWALHYGALHVCVSQDRWEDFDLDHAEGRFPVTKTKSRHIMSLSLHPLAIFWGSQSWVKFTLKMWPGHMKRAWRMECLGAYKRLRCLCAISAPFAGLLVESGFKYCTITANHVKNMKLVRFITLKTWISC